MSRAEAVGRRVVRRSLGLRGHLPACGGVHCALFALARPFSALSACQWARPFECPVWFVGPSKLKQSSSRLNRRPVTIDGPSESAACTPCRPVCRPATTCFFECHVQASYHRLPVRKCIHCGGAWRASRRQARQRTRLGITAAGLGRREQAGADTQATP
jgi:hypothetical protein